MADDTRKAYTMNRTVMTMSTIAACSIGLAACEQQGAGDETAGPAASAPAAEIVIPDDVSIPSAEQAAEEAAQITAENADAAFEELSREIEADDDDG